MQSRTMDRMLAGHVVVHPYAIRDIEDLLDDMLDAKARGLCDAVRRLVRAGTHHDAFTVGAIINNAAAHGCDISYVEFGEYVDCGYLEHEWTDRVDEFRTAVAERKTRERATAALSISDPGITDRLSRIISGAPISKDGSCIDGDTSMTNVADEMDAMVKSGVSWIKTGFRALDDSDYPMPPLVNPLRPGQQIVIGARPSVGKTAFAISLMTRMDARSLYFSKEMPYTDIATRAFAQVTRTPYMQYNDLDRWPQVSESLREWKQYYQHVLQKYHIYKSCHFTVDDIRAAINKYRPDVIFIDYLQIMASQEKSETRNEAVGKISRALKQIALELGVVTIILSQLTRLSAREKREPMLSDLRESGDIESDADIVMLLDRAVSVPDIDPKTDVTMESAMVYVRKQRSGRTGQARIRFVPEFIQFTDA